MPLIRPSALRSLQGSLRHSSARTTIRAVPSRTQLIARRYASSGGHGGHGEPSSDLPWLLTALAVTPPALWYLWPDTSHAEHHGGHEEHADDEEKEGEEEQSREDDAPQEDSASDGKADESEKGAEAENESDETSEEKPEEKSEEKSEEKPDDSKDNGESSETSESEGKAEKKQGGPENQGNTEDVQFKGKMKEDSDGRSDERKTEPRPSRGTNVKRIDSGLGKKLGEGSTYDEDDPKKESQATSKEAGSSPGDISNKQKGLSTTDTKHSIQIDKRDDKSTKGSGEPETAKAKGTVDSSGPITGGPGKN